MKISWFGETFFNLEVLKNKEDKVNILIDPFGRKSILADILLFTSNIDKTQGFGFSIFGPGEYEIKEVFIKGIALFSKNPSTAYLIEAEKMKILHLGKFLPKELEDWQLQEIGDLDILMFPLLQGDLKNNIKIISQLEPKILIPMMFSEKETLNKFLKEIKSGDMEPQNNLRIKKDDLPEETKIVVLKKNL